MNLLMFYLEHVEQFFEANACDIEDLDLISVDLYKQFIQALPEVYKNLVYKHISQLISIFVNNHQNVQKEAFNAFYEAFHGFLSSNIQTNCEKVMEIFADMAVLGIQW